MSATLSCCNACATTETVNVPGSEGAPGIDGTDGVSAFTTTGDSILLPAVGDLVAAGEIDVGSSAWMVVGQVVIIGDGLNGPGELGWGHFRVVTIPSATTVTLRYLGYALDKGEGQTLAAGCTVSPAGDLGP